MRVVSRLRQTLAPIDPWLAATLLMAALLCLYGIQWGRVECWNRDEMALRGLHGLRPGNFLKPPFHTYLNHLLVLSPFHVVEAIASFFAGTKVQFNEARLLGSRLVVMALFLGTIALGYLYSRRFYGKFAARVMALFLATSAGFVAYAHFLSADSPLLFWMLAVLVFAQRIVRFGEMRDYAWAGLLTGVCAATKYNGLAVGIAIPVAHLLSNNCASLRSCFFARRFLVGLLMVPIGFILANPYSIFDHKRFIADFMYNYTVTPRYEGQTGHGYAEFLRQFPEILGLPGAIALSVLALGSLVLVVWRRTGARPALQGFLLAGSVALLYYLKIGEFARMPTRFVLPAIPFFILMVGPCLQALQTRRRWVYGLLAPVILYNIFCSVYVGRRFSDDPRLAAQDWILAHVSRGRIIESSAGSPHWVKLRQLGAIELQAVNPQWDNVRHGETVDLRMQHANGRAELFGRIFKGNAWVEQQPRREGDANEELFTLAALVRRDPDFVTLHASDCNVPNDTVRAYCADLLDGRSPYSISFDGETPGVPWFIYPKHIDFLEGRMTILQRTLRQ